jgi:hypothetical protein
MLITLIACVFFKNQKKNRLNSWFSMKYFVVISSHKCLFFAQTTHILIIVHLERLPLMRASCYTRRPLVASVFMWGHS